MDPSDIVAVISSILIFAGGITASAFVARSAKGRQQMEILVAEKEAETARLAVEKEAETARLVAEEEAVINAKKLEAEITTSLLKYTDARIDRLELALDKERERGAKRITALEGKLERQGVRVLELTATVDELKGMIADRDAIIADLKGNGGYTKVSLYD